MTIQASLIVATLANCGFYTIRGVKVMLDADLAEIYGYSTSAFNQQVKNNIEKFDDDFRFQLTKEELSRCKNCILKMDSDVKSSSKSKIFILNNGERGSNIKFLPFAFTEQGIYMLMTVLKGKQATAQSKALIRLFKQMKDYIAAENAPDVSAGMVALATQTSQNTRDIAEIATDVRTLSNKVERNESFLQKVMANFIDPSTFKHFLILNGQRLEADVAYTQIYRIAKKSVLIVDDYLDVKTLDLLRCVEKGVSIKIFSEQHGRTRLTEIHCGASSKDAGNKITTIMQLEDIAGYRPLFEKLLQDEK
ncbi:ORF6N domain-containing protein [uncultured Fibrobacter sp.]|uniref:ORF6N domain-containing protein n=1 Tax=uncultured Fibrobacter sp. TaxID=261512 RepID=UPI0025EAE0E3|nr:ORF6N domain-containing protein [uncultured Fibrobacter sp.]